jgi:hypothetical protein
VSARLAALEAVAEAARDLETALACRDPLLSAPRNRLRAALDALPAQPLAAMPFYGAREPIPSEPQPQGETVTLAVWRTRHGEVRLAALLDADFTGAHWTRLGTVTLPIVRERGE